jgi:hypothetical protein
LEMQLYVFLPIKTVLVDRLVQVEPLDLPELPGLLELLELLALVEPPDIRVLPGSL